MFVIFDVLVFGGVWGVFGDGWGCFRNLGPGGVAVPQVGPYEWASPREEGRRPRGVQGEAHFEALFGAPRGP